MAKVPHFETMNDAVSSVVLWQPNDIQVAAARQSSPELYLLAQDVRRVGATTYWLRHQAAQAAALGLRRWR